MIEEIEQENIRLNSKDMTTATYTVNYVTAALRAMPVK